MPKRKKYVRPVQVRYYNSERDMPDHYARWGSCMERVNIVRGAFFHVATQKFAMARIYEDGMCTMTVKLNDHGMPQAYFGGKPIPLPNGRKA